MLPLPQGIAVPGMRWNRPKGGMFLWLEPAQGWNAEELLPIAAHKGVAFVPGAPFFVRQPKTNTCRFNFSHSDAAQMKAGMERLAEAMSEYRVFV